MKSVFNFEFDGDNYQTTGARHVEFGVEIDHKYPYKLCMEYYL